MFDIALYYKDKAKNKSSILLDYSLKPQDFI